MIGLQLPLGVLFTGLLCITQVYGCDRPHLQQCKLEFAQATHVTEEELDDVTPGDKDEDSLRLFCQSHDEYRECIRSYDGHCPLNIQLQVDGLENKFDYICGDGFYEYLEHSPCLNKRSLGIDIATCTVGKLLTLHFQPPEDDEEACGIALKHVECIGEAVEEAECGADAARLRKKIEILGLMPVHDTFGCDLLSTLDDSSEDDYSSSSSTTEGPKPQAPPDPNVGGVKQNDKDDDDDGELGIGVICGIIGAVLVLIVICVAIGYCCAKRTKKGSDPESAETNDNHIRYVAGPADQITGYPGPPADYMAAPPEYSTYDNIEPSKVALDDKKDLDEGSAYDNHAYESVSVEKH